MALTAVTSVFTLVSHVSGMWISFLSSILKAALSAGAFQLFWGSVVSTVTRTLLGWRGGFTVVTLSSSVAIICFVWCARATAMAIGCDVMTIILGPNNIMSAFLFTVVGVPVSQPFTCISWDKRTALFQNHICSLTLIRYYIKTSKWIINIRQSN